MEMTLNTGAFEELNSLEMNDLNGGSWVGGFIAGAVVDGIVKAATGKSCADWVADGFKYVGSKIIRPAYTDP